MDLVEKIVTVHQSLAAAELPHAFGGALALAWCTSRARGTIDIDINIFIPAADFMQAINALPSGVIASKKDLLQLKQDGQVRLWWGKTPLDLFLNTTDFHKDVMQRVRWELFGGEQVPFLACRDIAFFKAFFNRTKDWADLEDMHEAGTLDVALLIGLIIQHLGNDERVEKLQRSPFKSHKPK
jgi:hypothetical protein